MGSQRLPHLLLYGPPGTGKTSTILALARRIYGSKNMRQMVLELNASDDRGIDVVREQIKTFASVCRSLEVYLSQKLTRMTGTKQIFTSMTKPSDNTSIASFKLIILDEADAMTSTAQMALRRIMEKYTANTRFCIIANYTHKLSPALLSRCTRFRFSPLKEPDIRSLVDQVIEQEKVNIQPDAVDSLVTLSKGDMRRALNVLQACHASSKKLCSPTSPLNLIIDSHRYAARNKVRSKPCLVHRAHHQCHHLYLHRRTASLGHSNYPQDPTLDIRHHFLSLYHQYTEDLARSSPGRHPDRPR